jgi:hypothetical protein
VELLERTQQSILKLFSAEEVEKAVGASAGGGGKDGKGGKGGKGKDKEEFDPALSSAIADLHKFSMMQARAGRGGGGACAAGVVERTQLRAAMAEQRPPGRRPRAAARRMDAPRAAS